MDDILAKNEEQHTLRRIADYQVNLDCMNKRNIIIAIIVIVLIVIIAMASSKRDDRGLYDDNTMPQQPTTAIDSTVTGPQTPPSKPGTKPVALVPLTYKDALAKFEGKIVRVTDECLTTPTTFTLNLTAGQEVMIANDSKTKAHVVSIWGTTYSIPAQYYKIVTTKTVGGFSTTCDPKTGVTTVSVKQS